MRIEELIQKYNKIEEIIKPVIGKGYIIVQTGDIVSEKESNRNMYCVVSVKEKRIVICNTETFKVKHIRDEDAIKVFNKNYTVVSRQITVLDVLKYLEKYYKNREYPKFYISDEGKFLCDFEYGKENGLQVNINLSEPELSENLDLLNWFYDFIIEKENNKN